MSDDTYAALEDAIRAHITNQQGADRFIVDWALAVSSKPFDDNSTGYGFTYSDSQPHALEGLTRRMLRSLEADEQAQ
ncbi:hypothetical protein MHY85_05205 [Cellulomonas sp. ACRRI]|uniref:hypothetical protein n=1 Tax=Cellulomonas sp. ACRRI TaxID=2918188 RepID=UPI001EF2CFE0|nr:hypothetical protein [Cellulomonas sp. ACRRI]MCG7285373.1 hypothetical protein [Cellulomonas sp. ACRRI]